MMEHVLDNPAWYALTTGNSNLANGNGQVKFFAGDIGPFVGFEENTTENFEQLYQLTDPDRFSVFISPEPVKIYGSWKAVNYIPCLQMIYNGSMAEINADILNLTNEDVPQMLALTQLTNPGPFLQRTIEFGHYQGIFHGDKLIAMAGQRMNPLPYAEISAVCTHPDHTGKGYARQLLLSQTNRIKAEGNIPFLHVREDNHNAIKVYESIGFVKRASLHFYALIK